MKKRAPATDARKGLRVVGYVRVSSLRQVHEGDSIESQKSMITRYIEMKQQFKTWEVESVEFYVESGRSAKDLNRPELQRLKRDAEAGQIDIVVCYKFDRLSRKLRDFLEFSETLHRYGVRVVSLSEDIDTSGHGGEAMLQIMLVLAEWERKQTRERTIDGMTQRAERGLWNGGYLLGYSRVEGGKGTLAPDAEWAAKVKTFFFDKFEELGSVSAVQAWLERNGVVQPVWKSRTERMHGGTPFSEQQVKRVLTNRRYLGENRWGDNCIVPNSFTPIITIEQFERVQRKLAENARTRANHRHPRGHDYPLKGLVRCRRCGSMMTPSSVKKAGAARETRYYRCTRQSHFAGATSCAAKLVPAAALEQAVVNRLRQISLSAEERERVAAEAVKMIESQHGRFESEAAVLRQRLAAVQSEINSLINSLKAVGGNGAELLQTELDRLQKEQSELRQRLQILLQEAAPLSATMEKAKEFVSGWTSVAQILDAAQPDELRLLLQHFVEVIELADESADGRTGVYALRLFPEVRPLDRPREPENQGGVNSPESGERPALTDVVITCGDQQKAPRDCLNSIQAL